MNDAQAASNFTIRLDKSRPHSECRGERLPDDPHYRVHFWQGRKVGAKIILLPFDAGGVLVSDDGKTERYMGTTVDSKPVEHWPLYNKDMRDLVARMRNAANKPVPEAAPEDAPIELVGSAAPADELDFVAYLRGEIDYTPQQLRAAAKAVHFLNQPTIPELVNFLVLDKNVVPEDQVCARLKAHLPKSVAA